MNGMYDIFRQNFQQYLSLYRQELATNPFLLNVISPFYGLSDFAIYEEWKLSNDLRYYEASNIIHELTDNTSLPTYLRNLGNSFLEHGYDSIAGSDFDPDVVKEQMKLLYMMTSPAS